jgi:hypothetical protein
VPPVESNVAVTVVSPFSWTWQGPVPLQPPPDQPANFEPDAAVAASATVVPFAKVVVQFVPQSIPPGELDTVPLPEPARVTVSV